MPAKRTTRGSKDTSGATRANPPAEPPAPHDPASSAVIERRIRRLQEELDGLARSRPWGPALGFTAAWLGLIVVLVGLVTRSDLVWLAGVIAMLAGLPAFLATTARRRQETRLRAEIEEQEGRLEWPGRSPVDRLLDAHLGHLDRHLRLVAEHADRGFLAAVATAGVGVLLIVIGLVLGFRGGEGGRDVAWIAAVAGLGMQLVAGLLFFLYVRSLGHLQAFQERLQRSQQTLLAFTEASALSDGEDRERVIAGLIAAVVADGGREDGAEGGAADVLGVLRRASS